MGAGLFILGSLFVSFLRGRKIRQREGRETELKKLKSIKYAATGGPKGGLY